MLSCNELFKTFSVFIISIQILFGVFRWIYANVIGPKCLAPKNLREYGSWAMVTGATDGIGKEYAISLAKRGLNIILVSRTLSKLEDVASEISKSYNVETQVIAVNFTSGPEIYDQIKKQIIGKEIGILVNNVGIMYIPDLFLNIPDREQLIQDIIRCNVTSVPMMCSLILPQMVQRKRGLIINISSLSSAIPSPGLSIYSASKAFVAKFSEDLAAEYNNDGINIQVLIAGIVSTKMNKLVGSTFSIPTANEYVESALNYVGYAQYTTGFLSHAVLQFLMQLMHFVAPSTTEGISMSRLLAHRTKMMKDHSTQVKLSFYFFYG